MKIESFGRYTRETIRSQRFLGTYDVAMYGLTQLRQTEAAREDTALDLLLMEAHKAMLKVARHMADAAERRLEEAKAEAGQ